MHLNHLYSSILRGQWMISLVDVESSQAILKEILAGSSKDIDAEILSDRKPLKIQMVDKQMKSSYTKEETPAETVAVIPMHGTMLKYGSYCAYGTTEIADKIYEAAANENVVGIILDIDSGGGCVDAIAPLTAAIRSVQAQGKPIVALCDLCASAAYFVACACDEVIASNTISAEFGSIGVMMSFMDYSKYYADLGIKEHVIYSNLSTYKNAAFEAAKNGDYTKIKSEELDPLARRFQDSVKECRGSKLDLAAEGLLNGRMFYAEDAKKVGLIDSIKSYKEAVDDIRQTSRDRSIQAYYTGE